MLKLLLAVLLIPQTITVRNETYCEVMVSIFQSQNLVAQFRLRPKTKWPIHLDLDPIARVSYKIQGEGCIPDRIGFMRWPLPNESNLLILSK